MDERVNLHTLLQAVLPGLPIFFRPPAKDILTYPCIVYTLSDLPANHSNNTAYIIGETYKVTVMYRVGPDILNTKVILSIPGSSLATTYENENIVHDVFNIVMNPT
jgi:hypothetical protein